jgi:coenzyme F420-0:L-glutamate ligase / coenzyme F420-1:gamma-L-glutamate ligase
VEGVSGVPAAALSLWPIAGLGEIAAGDDLAGLVFEALSRQGLALQEGDVLVVTQKVVSKAEGCAVDLRTVEPSTLAREWSQRWDKDPRVTELVLREAARIVRMDRGVIIAETRHGHICANAGVDRSNVSPDTATTLPVDPDASAERLRAALQARAGVRLGVVISDTFGRAWREGQTNVAIGVAGLMPLRHFEGLVDPAGYELRVTQLAIADELASAAELVMGKLDRVPVALARGVAYALGEGSAHELVRPAERDMFR